MNLKNIFIVLFLTLFFSCAPTTAKIESRSYPSNKKYDKKIFVAIGNQEKIAQLTDQIALKLDSILTANKFNSYVYKFESNLISEDDVKAKIKEFKAPLLMTILFSEGSTINGKLDKASFANVLIDTTEKTILWKSKIDMDIGDSWPYSWDQDGILFSNTLFNDLTEKNLFKE